MHSVKDTMDIICNCRPWLISAVRDGLVPITVALMALRDREFRDDVIRAARRLP